MFSSAGLDTSTVTFFEPSFMAKRTALSPGSATAA